MLSLFTSKLHSLFTRIKNLSIVLNLLTSFSLVSIQRMKKELCFSLYIKAFGEGAAKTGRGLKYDLSDTMFTLSVKSSSDFFVSKSESFSQIFLAFHPKKLLNLRYGYCVTK